MKTRMGPECAGSFEPQALGEQRTINGVGVRLAPAGHILGSAQVVLDWNGQRAVVSGDYKRAADPTCPTFEVVPCDVFVTEATFALPVFRHEPAESEVGRLLGSIARQPERAHLVGVYGLGKMPARDQARARGGLRPADLPARRARRAVRALSTARRRSRRAAPGDDRQVRGLRRRARSVPAVRRRRPLVAPLPRSRHRLRLRLDAHQGRASASAASSCRSSSPTTPTGPSCSTPSSKPAPRTCG